MRKYGVDNFHIEIIKQCPREELNYYEKYYIEKYNTFAPNGYNATLGGDGTLRYDYKQLVEDYYSLGENITKVCEKNNCTYQTVRNALREYNITPHSTYAHLQTPVYECDKDNNIIKEFSTVDGIIECYPELNLTRKGIDNFLSSVMANRGKTYYGHYFCRKSDYDIYKKESHKDNRLKSVKCVELNMFFKSFMEAARYLKEINPDLKSDEKGMSSNIQRAIKRNIKAYGYTWERLN